MRGAFEFGCDHCGRCFNLVNGELVGYLSGDIYPYLCDDGVPHRFSEPLELGEARTLAVQGLRELEMELR